MSTEKMTEAGIDYEDGVIRFAGKAELYEMFLKRFPEDANFNKLMEELGAENLEDKNLEEAFKAAHALKGVTGNLSLNRLYERTAALVEELRNKKTDNLKPMAAAVRESYEETVAAIGELA